MRQQWALGWPHWAVKLSLVMSQWQLALLALLLLAQQAQLGLLLPQQA